MVKPTEVTNSIRALRFTHGEMTQAELADRIGVTRQTVIAIEKGRYSPSLQMAFQIARAFRVPLDTVFQYPDDDASDTGTDTGTGSTTDSTTDKGSEGP
ncbi:helix-turn-helix transcriptional regulator [Streptomyces sp. NPDC098789]|uniref:helix-turn-helix transcriptional regulator n=1 Tax=Streptomyces sp. NPDC098789 TaxID=3366098 RepID=UPI0038273896